MLYDPGFDFGVKDSTATTTSDTTDTTPPEAADAGDTTKPKRDRPKRVKLGKGGKVVKFPGKGGDSAAMDIPNGWDTNNWFKVGLHWAEKIVQIALLPIAIGGAAIAFTIRELLSSRFYPLVGGCIAALGMALSAEAYAVGLGQFKPFIPKLALRDGASLTNLWEILSSPNAGSFWFLVFSALCLQLVESVVWRNRGGDSKKRKGKKQTTAPWLLWILVMGAYFLDGFAVFRTYSHLGFSVPLLIWGTFALFGSEFGLSLAQRGGK